MSRAVSDEEMYIDELRDEIEQLERQLHNEIVGRDKVYLEHQDKLIAQREAWRVAAEAWERLWCMDWERAGRRLDIKRCEVGDMMDKARKLEED